MKKRMIIQTVVLSILFASDPSWVLSSIISVPSDSTTIQGGIDGTQVGDTVLVMEGTYYELIDFKGKGITVASTYIIDFDSTSIIQTIIDGDSSQIGENGSVVSFINGEYSTSILCGFTIRNGSGTYIVDDFYEGYAGGGIIGFYSSPIITHNIIKNNNVDARPIDGIIARGGGIYFNSGSPQISENLIMNNRAVGYYYPSNLGEGGGICLYDCYEAEAQIRDNNIIYNESWAVGAGIYAKDSWLSINNNNISYNIERSGVAGSTEDYHGMAILVYNNTINFNGLTGINMSEGCYPQIKNNLIAFNKIAHGISINTFIPAIIENNTVIGNGFEEDYPGSGIYLSYASAEIKNNIIALNKRYGVFSYTPFPNTIIDYNNVWGNIEGGYYGYESGANDISVNPYFKDPFNGDFTLSSLSPCIDAGNPETEIPQNGGDRIDIGALEYYQPFNGYLTFEGYPQGIQTGSVATWDVSLMNPTSEPQTIDAWIEYSGPSCGVAKRFLDITVPPGEWNETIELTIPDYVLEGAYTVKGRVGIFGEEIWDSEVFDLNIQPGPRKVYVSQ